MSEAILEEMRERLVKEGAFDRFKHKNEDEMCGEIDIKIAQLRKSMNERHEEAEPTVWFEYTPTDRPLTLDEAEKIEDFFTKKDLSSVLMKKQLPIDSNLRKDRMLVEISKYGFIPKCYRRVKCCVCQGNIVVNEKYNTERIDYQVCEKCDTCKRCGKTIHAEELPIEKLKDAQQKGRLHCSICEKELDALNKPNGSQIPLFS